MNGFFSIMHRLYLCKSMKFWIGHIDQSNGLGDQSYKTVVDAVNDGYV